MLETIGAKIQCRKPFQGWVKKDVTQAQLVERLDGIGINRKKVDVANRLSLGRSAAAFNLKCLSALKMDTSHSLSLAYFY
ncbi:DUF6471 domain-containing protein [Sulfitobacter pontiacus]|uniref:DUF6471 domain-containing protein n=1 Tax=Sulfitobacter pontiacus TaxID=60137 RepID=UPI0030EF6B4B